MKKISYQLTADQRYAYMAGIYKNAYKGAELFLPMFVFWLVIAAHFIIIFAYILPLLSGGETSAYLLGFVSGMLFFYAYIYYFQAKYSKKTVNSYILSQETEVSIEDGVLSVNAPTINTTIQLNDQMTVFTNKETEILYLDPFITFALPKGTANKLELESYGIKVE